MSADNYLRVVQVDEAYEVRDGNASTGFESTRKSFNKLEDAIRFATEIQENEIVEYGMSVSLAEPEKEEV